ncbi:MAG: polysaccharide deacetylase [Ruminococcaceae bacterium]|nr:polysaccharide deacetylase [Oscillospiraceae bacterium]
MIQYHVYPGGKKRVVTFSYDDGSSNDARLVEMFNKYGVKGTFHLNGGKYIAKSDEELAAVRELYEGHEISCHTVHHGWPARMPVQSVVSEVMEDRRVLENMAGYPVIGMSYPSGSYSEEAIAALRACGIVYSRTVKSTKSFLLPENFLEWHPTCHHKDALPLCDKFLRDLDSEWTHPMFYIWGHSHEFRTEEEWQVMEQILQKLAGNDKIWYATNIEIYNYMMAQRMLQISADERVFYNPTATDLWVEKNKKQIVCIPAGGTVTLRNEV